MSGRRHRQTERDTSPAAGGAKQKAPVPRHDGPAAVPGNQAVRELLEGGSPARALPAELRARLERSLGIPLHTVTVRSDAAAREAARALDARAFTHGEEIYLGPEAPSPDSPEAESVLAHEAAHIAQQRGASLVTDAVSAPGDAWEQQADRAAAQAMAGAQAERAAGGSVPGVQRQQAGGGPRQATAATRAEVEQALLAFLQRVLARTPGADLRRTRVVRNALDTLVRGGGPSAALVDVDDFLKGVPNDAAEFARRFTQRLPQSIGREALERLNRLATADSTEGSAVTRVVDLYSRTQAGGPEQTEDPQRVTPQQSAEQAAQVMRRWRGQEEPTEVGPVNVDVLQMNRFIRGLPGAIHPPAPRTGQPAAGSYPEVEAAIQRIPEDALTPAEFRGGARAGEFADAREFARDAARQIDVAQQQRRDTVTIHLGDNYNQVRDRQAMRAAVEEIIAAVRAALPHHGSNVLNVDVYFGRNLVTRGRPRQGGQS